MHSYDRRHSDRYYVAGGKVHFTTHKGEPAFSPLADLTQSSIKFEIDEELIVGDQIEVVIEVPGFRVISVKGWVAWTSNPLLDSPAFAVVQFLPFGTDPRYNTMRSHDQIKTIIEQRSRRIAPDRD